MADFTLTLFQDDDTTPYFEVGTAATHPAPYLHRPEVFAESEVDLLKGTARIGRLAVRVIDPQDGPDQTHRFLTERLGTPEGYSALNGRRARLQQVLGGVVIDGICAGVTLSESFAGFVLSLEDVRARGIKVKAFNRARTATVFPRGVLDGYGRLPAGGWLVPPTAPLRATYREEGGSGWFDLPSVREGREVEAQYIASTKMRELTRATIIREGERARWVHQGVEVLWRLPGADGWARLRDIDASNEHIVTPLGYTTRGALLETVPARWRGPRRREHVDAEAVSSIFAGKQADGQVRPFDGWQVEVLVLYSGPPTEDYPFHYEGTWGEFVRNLLRGDYSADGDGNPFNPRLRYEEARLLDPTGPFAIPIRIRQTKVVDDLRKYLEELCRIIGAAPALDDEGRISPVLSELPPEGAPLFEINDGNAAPIPGWDHPIADAVTVVRGTYPRDTAVPAEEDPFHERSSGDGISTADQMVRVESTDPSVLQVMGEQVHELDAFCFRTLAGVDRQPLSGDITDETGWQLFYSTGHALIDRFAYGGEVSFCKVRQEDAAGISAGTWGVDSHTWKRGGR